MEKINVILKRGEDGMFLAVPEHNFPIGLHGYGKTANEAIADLNTICQEAKEFYPELPDFEYNIMYEVPSFLKAYSQIFSLAGLQQITGVNQKQLSHYLNGNSYPSKQTTEKIKTGFNNFRHNLSNVQFA